VSVLGTVGFTTEGEIFLDAETIFKDRLSELSMIREKVDGMIWSRNVWLALSTLGSIYVGRRAYLYLKKKGYI